MKKISVFLNLLIFIVCFSIVGQAQTLNMDFNIETGFDGKCKLGGMNPVKVMLTTKTDPVKGALKIIIGERVYTHPINLAENTKKEVAFSIPVLKGNEEIIVSIERDEEIIQNESLSLEVFPEDTVFIGVLSEQPENYYGIKEIKNDLFADKNIEVIKLKDTMTYPLKELENFNLLLIDNFLIENLSSETQENLKKWIAHGNIVLIGKNQYAYKNLTGIFEGIEEKQNIGDGWVIPVKDFNDIEAIGNRINQNMTFCGINKVVNINEFEKRINASKNIYGAVDHLLNPTYKRVFFLVSFLVIYLLLLGLFMFFGKKQWIFPMLIISFSFIFYGFSFIGGFAPCKVVSAAIKINHHGVDSYKFTSLYPDKKENMSFEFVNDDFIDVLGSTDYILDPINQVVNYSMNEEEQLEEKEPYSLYREETRFGENSPMILSLEGDSLKGQIINPMPETMYNCFLLLGDTVISLGDLDGKEKKSIDYQLDNNLKLLGDYNYLEKIYEVANLKDYESPMFEYYFYHMDQSPYNGHVFGFSKDMEKVNSNGQQEKAKEMILNVFDVKLSNKEKVYMPCEFVKPIVSCEENEEKEEKREYILEEGKEISVYYSIPKGLKVEEINLYTKVDGGKIILEVYNQDMKVWEALTSEKLTKGYVRKYIEKAPLMIKIKGNGRIILPQLDIKGRKGEVGGVDA
ncbi:MAG: hypothetical protein N4A62_20745 [Marinisporobacter sp.]|jgi:hypothetical protein|nr:hypothetical protein [Marinisporobacter sp.]